MGVGEAERESGTEVWSALEVGDEGSAERARAPVGLEKRMRGIASSEAGSVASHEAVIGGCLEGGQRRLVVCRDEEFVEIFRDDDEAEDDFDEKAE